MVQAFDIVGRGHENPSMQELILSIKADVEGGTALADALKKHPLQFDDLFVNLVRAGEHAGVLEGLLDKIATYKEKTESIKAKIKKAMFYPVSIVVVAIVVTAVIMIFVIPQFENIFSSFGADLPVFTKLVIKIAHFVQGWWWAILGGAIAAGYCYFRHLETLPKIPTDGRPHAVEDSGHRHDSEQIGDRPLLPHPGHHVRRRRPTGGGPRLSCRRYR